MSIENWVSLSPVYLWMEAACEPGQWICFDALGTIQSMSTSANGPRTKDTGTWATKCGVIYETHCPDCLCRMTKT